MFAAYLSDTRLMCINQINIMFSHLSDRMEEVDTPDSLHWLAFKIDLVVQELSYGKSSIGTRRIEITKWTGDSLSHKLKPPNDHDMIKEATVVTEEILQQEVQKIWVISLTMGDWKTPPIGAFFAQIRRLSRSLKAKTCGLGTEGIRWFNVFAKKHMDDVSRRTTYI